MVSSLPNQVPIEWEKKAGDKLFTTMSLQYKFIQNDSLKKVFLKISDPLFKQVEKDGYKIDLYFVKDPTINAFALPGGKVIIQTGLIENAKSWEEVMGVLGHELAHVTKRHHIRSMIILLVYLQFYLHLWAT
ncbi:MAG: M48 family metallopeptidase [Bacteroidetes bacterium]|nr:M48 family metallopeptidase [Bacteroidota bacterium]